jgi:hypothetical protein
MRGNAVAEHDLDQAISLNSDFAYIPSVEGGNMFYIKLVQRAVQQ